MQQLLLLKVSKSQNKFMKSWFLPKNERNIARISALNVRAGILAIFRSFFGRNDVFKNLFWDLLTFTQTFDQGCSKIDLNIKHGRVQVLHGALRFKCNEGFSLKPKSLRTLKCANLKLPSVVLPQCLPTRPPNDEPRLEGGEDYEGKVILNRYQAYIIT